MIYLALFILAVGLYQAFGKGQRRSGHGPSLPNAEPMDGPFAHGAPHQPFPGDMSAEHMHQHHRDIQQHLHDHHHHVSHDMHHSPMDTSTMDTSSNDTGWSSDMGSASSDSTPTE